ncbi:MAG: hypothetical protein HN542_05815 [Flavobacteriales bacterium]|nr:hypothetical protein [Flavobacteriales bacterium]MBT3964098.1 hypothetical protein [Flavobacteriales bacterium]MBT4705167.1 hypothetical protein [Flavobacteriales bacterium]MBT4930417.1 hypothetical protein [Flavobacteriales bacterium]MBT5132640.1 hypothetical protein [Flavobacteriales bacterium]
MRWVLIIAILVLCAVESSAQRYYWQSGTKEKKIKNLTIDGGGGFRMYTGDIKTDGSLFNKWKLAYGLGARYQWRPKIGFALELAGRSYEGEKDHGGYEDALDQMTGKLWEGNLTFQYSFLRWEDFTVRQFTDRDPVRKTNGYVGVGFGGALFSSSYTSRMYVKQTVTWVDSITMISTDTTIFVPIDNSGSGGGFGMYVPVVFGMRYRFTPAWSLGFEMQYHVYITKNIDALATKKYDGMFTAFARVGYTFGQKKRQGDVKKFSKKGKGR